MNTLAQFGGKKVREKLFPPYPVLGDEEKDAVLDVLKGGRLSTFIAQPGESFLGGQRIRAFEKEFADYNGVKFAVAFNSATAALHAAVVAVGVKPGEEVITTPYTFTSSATCALMHNAIPVFADIDDQTFCLDPVSVRQRLSPLTRAIIPVHLFGHPAPMDELIEIAKENKLRIIEDCAQAPGALYKGRKVGTLADCGIFSFQESKNMMTGEGGMLITNDEAIAEVARLIRNHGEAIAESMASRSYASEILGWGYRMTEFEAAIGRVQLRHLNEWNAHRRKMTDYLRQEFKTIPGLTPPVVKDGCEHVYYLFSFLYDEKTIGLPRNVFADAVRAEGIPMGTGYIKPLYFSPLYQNKQAFVYRHYTGNVSYAPGICPVAEKLYRDRLLTLAVCRPPASIDDMKDIVTAVRKVLENRPALLEHTRAK